MDTVPMFHEHGNVPMLVAFVRNDAKIYERRKIVVPGNLVVRRGPNAEGDAFDGSLGHGFGLRLLIVSMILTTGTPRKNAESTTLARTSLASTTSRSCAGNES